MKKVALVACSNAQKEEDHTIIEELKKVFWNMGIETVESPFLYAENGYVSGTEKERAEVLNQFYRDETIDAIFDVSGGDMANELLPYIDFEAIAKSNKQFYGYSDLTTIINAIYAKTGRSSVLFQIKNLVLEKEGIQRKQFQRYFNGEKDIFEAEWNILQGEGTVERLLGENIVVGGNIRCFLKLAGTPYFPNLQDKVLFLEGFGGTIPQISTYMACLYQIGVFEKVKGILLGTFTRLEQESGALAPYEIIRTYLPKDMFVAKTAQIGHASNSRALKIG